MYLIFAILLYIFRVYVDITHEEKMYVVLLLASIYSLLFFILNINNNLEYNNISLIDKNIISIFYISICIALSYFLPTTISVLLSVIIFKEVFIYFNLYRYIHLTVF
jgi:hypothetical protein